jgi:hypothetical protein
MKVFISWSGDYSRELGRAMNWWLPKVLNPVDVFFSDTDIESGARWYHAIVDALERSDAGLVILTPENITRQWIMFEAGAIARSVAEGRVCPILFGLERSELMGPLAFFQSVEFVEGDFRKLQKTINNGKLDEADLNEMFENWWPKLKERIQAIAAAPQPALKKPNEIELLQEILNLTRSLVRELQPLPPRQRLLPEAVAAVDALLRRNSNATLNATLMMSEAVKDAVNKQITEALARESEEGNSD